MSREPANPPPTAAELRERFDAAPPYTVGLEDEVMVLDPETYELMPRAPEVLERLGDDPAFKLELPASQLEIVVGPSDTVPEAARELLARRHELAARAEPLARFAGAGFHPTSPSVGTLNRTVQYEPTIREHGRIAERQLVCAFQVHVAVPGADRALAVYNTVREYLPLLAALAANSPFYEGRDAGLASVRAKVGELLPRQGVPPALENWEDYADALAWGAETGIFPHSGSWWYELRPHPRFGTLELRVPDGQTTIADSAAVAAVAQALIVWLGERYDAGERTPPAPTWRIEQNRWSACRYGVEGFMAELRAGTRRPTRDCLYELLDALEPVAARLGAASAWPRARRLVEVNGALAQRELAARAGIPAVAGWLASRFLDPSPG